MTAKLAAKAIRCLLTGALRRTSRHDDPHNTRVQLQGPPSTTAPDPLCEGHTSRTLSVATRCSTARGSSWCYPHAIHQLKEGQLDVEFLKALEELRVDANGGTQLLELGIAEQKSDTVGPEDIDGRQG